MIEYRLYPNARRGFPVLIWKPVIEPDFGQERFLTEDPTKLFKNGDFMRIPIIAGITKLEDLEYPVSKFSSIV